jgi:hypothetical protein
MIMHRLSLGLTALYLCTTVLTGQEVHFADENLKAAVEDALWVLDPTPSDMLGLTALSCVDRGVTDIAGLEYAENLQKLNLRFNRISSISRLSGLRNLRRLDLSRNYEISSVSALSELTHLYHLNLHINNIDSISGLSELTDLTFLDLHGNHVHNISALSRLDKLKHLDLNENAIEDITALSGLRRLETLYLHFNHISDISALVDLTELRVLNIYLNNISDISALANLTKLQTLSLHYNQVVDISALSELTQLTQVSMHANPIKREACDIYLPRILANNPGIHLEFDECEDGHTLTISSTAGGSVVEPGEGFRTYDSMEAVTLAATPSWGYRFQNWTGTAVTAGKVDNPNNANATVIVDEDYTLEANFLTNIIHVDDDAPGDPRPHDLRSSDPLEDGTAEHPFDSIQEAIADAASDGFVLVRPGSYYEGINLMGKDITVTGIDPCSAEITALPVIDGNDVETIVTFEQGEGPQCQFSGFVLTRGRNEMAGAIVCLGSSPTIRNCLIAGNLCDGPYGAIIYCQDSSPVFENLTVHGNNAGNTGAVFRFMSCHAVISNSILWGNVPDEILVEADPDPLISYSNVMGTWPGPGNIEVNPEFAWPGMWTTDPLDPNSIWIPGDYHLASEDGRWDPNDMTWIADELTSPCVDAGDPNRPCVHEPMPNGTRINMGVYGGTDQASRSLEEELGSKVLNSVSDD